MEASKEYIYKLARNLLYNFEPSYVCKNCCTYKREDKRFGDLTYIIRFSNDNSTIYITVEHDRYITVFEHKFEEREYMELKLKFIEIKNKFENEFKEAIMVEDHYVEGYEALMK